LSSCFWPDEVAAYLDAALKGEDRTAFLLVIKDVNDANGGVKEVAALAHLNREAL